MKNYIITAIICFCVGSLVTYIDLTKTVKPIIVNPEVVAADSLLTDSLQRANDSISDMVNSKVYQAEKYKASAATLHNINEVMQVELDSLRLFYKTNFTLTICDSLVGEQQTLIDSLNIENNQLDMEAESYSKALYLERKISINKDTIIKSKIKLIDSYNLAIAESNCVTDWGSRHKFWKWLLRIKCN